MYLHTKTKLQRVNFESTYGANIGDVVHLERSSVQKGKDKVQYLAIALLT